LDEAGDLLIPREPSALGLVVKDRRRVIVGDGDLEGGWKLEREVGRFGRDGSFEGVGKILEEDVLFGAVAQGPKLDEVKDLDEGEFRWEERKVVGVILYAWSTRLGDSRVPE
jgi:hypothetical protein